MAILGFNPIDIGFVGNFPRLVSVLSNDNFATITTAGYLNSFTQQGNAVYPTDYLFMAYGSDSATHGIFFPTFSSGTITLNPYIGQGNVQLPVIVNHIATFKATDGQIGDDSATAINGGNIQAGLSGTAGYLASFPATASTGSLEIKAVSNTGNTVTTISNAAMGQASVISVPDPAAATANFLIAPAALVNGNLISANGTAGLSADSGVAVSNVQLKTQVLANSVSVPTPGGAAFSFTVSGVTSTSIVIATFTTQTNPASVLTVTTSPNTVAIIASANPGACTLHYIAYIAAQ